METMELLNTSLCRTKEICLITILGGIFFIVGLAIPIPTSLFMLYIFRDYKTVAINSMYLKAILIIITRILFIFDIFLFLLSILSVLNIYIVCKAVKYYNFNFSTATILKLGILNFMISVLPAFIITDILFSLLGISFINADIIVLVMYLYGMLFLLGFFSLSYLYSFNKFKETMDVFRKKILTVVE